MREPRKSETAFTWRGQPVGDPPTDEQCLVSCINNAENAAREASAAHSQYWSRRRAGEFEENLESLKHRYWQAKAAQDSWRGTASFYRERIAEKAERIRAEDARRAAEEARGRVGEIIALSREPGEDDEWEQERESAWADIGGAVAAGGR